MHKIQLITSLVILFNSITLISCDLRNPVNNLDEKLKAEKQQKFPPCKSCTMFVESFKKVSRKFYFFCLDFDFFLFLRFFSYLTCMSLFKGMEKTQRGKHGGGDAAWEEKKLGSYKTSELRLTEIQEMLCTDITRGEQQCHTIAEEYESDIESWWKNQDDFPDFFQWFCIETMKVCCPIGHYGADCKPCENCNSNGVCKGNGTRKGNGRCKCDEGEFYFLMILQFSNQCFSNN